MALDLTIASEANKAKLDSNYPATDLIAVLLQYIGTTADAFGRDVQTAGQVFHRALAVYEGIRALMAQVDQSTEAAPDWRSFDAYTTAIPQLEKLLLEFYAAHSDDKTRGLLPPADDVQSAISFIARWKHDRAMLNKALFGRPGARYLPGSFLDFCNLTNEVKAKVLESRQESRAKDDQTTLQALGAFFRSNRLGDRNILQAAGQTPVSDVKNLISVLAEAVLRLPSNAAAEEAKGLSIRVILLVYIPFAMTTVSAVPRKIRDHLKGGEIWKAMKTLLEEVTVYLQRGQSAKTIAELETLISQLEILLLGLTDVIIPLAEEILQLIKLAALIRRPFHGRSAALISVLRYLDDYSKVDEHKNVSTFRTELKEVMHESIAALQAAKLAVTDVKSFTLDSQAYSVEKTKLDDLYSTKVKKCFADFEITDQLSVWDQKFATGVSVDEEHLNGMRARLGL
ncbi:hypothetical protein M413DRAFT_442921 [Hebeloma cylindrosporum]|uniref:Uncharacterized protein n=1 Tax=Hebeloma cylindrosporum TaxID=76867 RepID=A0A0C3CMD7_HEBCY|nr:hypothetical protein M413DRAFT_442921 [Hebeloma cylindrosporum h7]